MFRCAASYRGHDELGTLAQSFNAMAETISRTQEGLERQVQDRTAQLRESEESYRRLFADNRAIMLQIDPSAGTIIAANAAAVEFYGYPAERLAGLPVEAINTLPREQIMASTASIRQGGGSRFEFQHRLADGSLRDVEVYSTFLHYGPREVCHSIIHDITDRKRIEAARLQAERLRRSLLDNSAVGIFCGSPDRTILEANARACAMFGYTPEEIQGQSFRLIHLSDEHFQNFAPQYASAEGVAICEHRFPLPAQGRKHSLVLGLRDPARRERRGQGMHLDPAGYHGPARGPGPGAAPVAGRRANLHLRRDDRPARQYHLRQPRLLPHHRL